MFVKVFVLGIMLMVASLGRAQEGATPSIPEHTEENLEAPSSVEQLSPETQALVDEGFAALHMGDTTRALGLFKQALALQPDSKSARLGRGTALIRLLRHQEAIDVLAPMLDEFPGDYFLRNNLAWLYATSDLPAIRNGDKAVALAQDALLLAPDDYHVWSTLSEAYFVSTRYEKAVRAAREALRLGREKKATAENIDTYKKQIEKSEKARRAMSILD